MFVILYTKIPGFALLFYDLGNLQTFIVCFGFDDYFEALIKFSVIHVACFIF